MKAKAERIEWLDSLRALAIFGVIIVHCKGLASTDALTGNAFLQFGQYGVHLFFLISTITTVRTLARSKYVSVWLLKRLLRIAPLYYTGVIFYTSVSFLKTKALGLPADLPSAQDILANFLFLNGWIPSANNNVVPGGWSIAVEVTFYVMAGLLLTKREVAPRVSSVATAILVSTLIILANAALNGWIIENNTFAYYWPLTQIPAFLIGYAVWSSLSNQTIPERTRAPYLVACAAGLALCYKLGATEERLHILVPPLLTASMWLGVLGAGAARQALSSAFTAYVGKISYSIYIFHFIVVDATRFILSRSHFSLDTWAEFAFAAASVTLISIGIASISFHTIEKAGAKLAAIITPTLESALNRRIPSNV